MKKIYVCVSLQNTAEETVQFARTCCIFVRNRGLMPMASHYMSLTEEYNAPRVDDLTDTKDYLEDIRIRREELKMSDEAWFFFGRGTDDPMIVDAAMAEDLNIKIRAFQKEDLCGFIMV